VLLASFIYSEKYTAATVDVLLFLVLLSLTGNIHLVNTWGYILHNPMVVVAGIVSFLLIGVAWARIKWILLVSKIKPQVDSWRADHARNVARYQADYDAKKAVYDADKVRYDRDPMGYRSPTEPSFMPPTLELSYELRKKVTLQEDGRVSIIIDNFKSRIIGWMAYWPVSIAVYILGDLVHDLFEKLFKSVRAHFQNAADRSLNS
jgi:hypothetical protein